MVYGMWCPIDAIVSQVHFWFMVDVSNFFYRCFYRCYIGVYLDISYDIYVYSIPYIVDGIVEYQPTYNWGASPCYIMYMYMPIDVYKLL